MTRDFSLRTWLGLLDEIDQEFNINVTAPTAKKWFNILAEHYDQPWRRYHNRDHVAALLQQFERRVRANTRAPIELQLAIWFHDAVMTPGASDNENRSRDLFEEFAEEIDLGMGPTELVAEMVLITDPIIAQGMTFRIEAERMADLDLTALGGTWEHFCSMGQQIQEEYTSQGGFSDLQFKSGRIDFFQRLLRSREHIYRTRMFRDLYEEAAQSNIARFLKEAS